MQLQSEKYCQIGKLEYRILWLVSKHVPPIITSQKDKLKILVKNKLKCI